MVAVEATPRRELSAEHISQAFNTLGYVNLSSDQSRALRDIGVMAKAHGILETMHGGVMITMHNLLDAAAKIRSKSQSADITLKELLECAKVQGYIAGSMAKVHATTVKGEHRAVEVAREADKAKRRSFPKATNGPLIDVTPIQSSGK